MNSLIKKGEEKATEATAFIAALAIIIHARANSRPVENIGLAREYAELAMKELSKIERGT